MKLAMDKVTELKAVVRSCRKRVEAGSPWPGTEPWPGGRALTAKEVSAGTLTGIVNADGNLVWVHPMPLSEYLRDKTLAVPLLSAVDSGVCR